MLPTVHAAVPLTTPWALALPVATALKLEISSVWPPGNAKATSCPAADASSTSDPSLMAWLELLVKTPLGLLPPPGPVAVTNEPPFGALGSITDMASSGEAAVQGTATLLLGLMHFWMFSWFCG